MAIQATRASKGCRWPFTPRKGARINAITRPDQGETRYAASVANATSISRRKTDVDTVVAIPNPAATLTTATHPRKSPGTKPRQANQAPVASNGTEDLTAVVQGMRWRKTARTAPRLRKQNI